MKRIITFLTTTLMFVAAANAGEATVETNDDNNGVSSTYIISDGDVLQVPHFSIKFGSARLWTSHDERYCNNLPVFYVGHVQLTDGFSFGNSDALSQGNSSYEWGMYLGAVDYALGKNMGASIGIGFSRTSIRFKGNNVIYMGSDDNMYFGPLKSLPDLDKSWIRYWSLRIPVTIGWETRKFGLSAGAELEWRTMFKARAKYNGSKHTIVDEPEYSPLAVNLIMNANVGEIVLTGRLGVTDLMNIHSSYKKSGTDFHLTPFMIGVGLVF